VAARRKKPSRARGASRGKQGTPSWMWLLTGILVGLGLAWYLFSKGYIPQPEAEEPASGTASIEGPGVSQEEVAPATGEQRKSRYDFFTVLPEMEVVVPEQELAQKREQQKTRVEPGDSSSYLLQVGSFRDGSDAEQMKAKMALLGVGARVQTVTVDGVTWHRVRVGPVSGAQEVDELRSRLAENGIDSLVMKNP
jgi:cell division protein FtsN